MKYVISVVTVAVTVVVIIPLLIVSLFSGVKPDSPESEGKWNLSGELPIVYESSRNINVFLEDENRSVDIPLEEYVTGVVASELPASFEVEALKAQAVAARTYGIAKEGGLCNTTHCQVYRSEEKIREIKGDEWMDTYWQKIKDAVYSTRGQVLYYNGELAGGVLFHSSSGGRTENSEDVFVSAVPYLRSVSSPLEEDATHKADEYNFYVSGFADLLNNKIPEKDITEADIINLKILGRTDGGDVSEVQIGKHTFTGRQIREFLNLSSADFDFRFDGDNMIVNSKGYGHGVGMSQYGANGMAKKGYTYEEILKHYYSGVEIENI